VERSTLPRLQDPRENTDSEAGVVIEGQPPELSIAMSLLPYSWDSNKARYLAYRACGFTNKEAGKLIGISQPSISQWRETDPKFVELEDTLPELQSKLQEQFLNMEFVRNFTLVLRKDYEVVNKSLDDERVMTKFDQDYLMKMRGQYTPQQLQVIRAIISDEGKKNFDFSKFIVEMARNADVVRLEVSR